MKFNQNDVKFIINKEQGIVIALLDKQATVKFKQDNFGQLAKNIYKKHSACWATRIFSTTEEPFVFKGIAKLHPNDKWDKNIGKRIALDKLQLKLKNYLAKEIYKVAKEMYKTSTEILEKVNKELKGAQYLSKKLKGDK